MEGREWDAEKNEDDFARGGRFDKRGGFAGDNYDYTDGREYLYREPRGRGGGRGGGRGAERGGRQVQDIAPKQEDFPALPSANTGAPSCDTPSTTDPTTADPMPAAGKSWADQVESSNPSG